MKRNFRGTTYHFIHILQLVKNQPNGKFRTFPVFFVVTKKNLKYVNKNIQLSQEGREVFGCLRQYKSIKLQNHQIKHIIKQSRLFQRLTSSSRMFYLLPIKSDSKLDSYRGPFMDYENLMEVVDKRCYDHSSLTVLEQIRTILNQSNLTLESLRENLDSGKDVNKCLEVIRSILEDLHGKLLVSRTGLHPRFHMICKSVDFRLTPSSKTTMLSRTNIKNDNSENVNENNVSDEPPSTTFQDLFLVKYPRVNTENIDLTQPIIISNGNFTQPLKAFRPDTITKDFYERQHESHNKKNFTIENHPSETRPEHKKILHFCLPQYFYTCLIPKTITNHLRHLHETLSFIETMERNESALKRIQRIYDIPFMDPLILQEALTHRTFSHRYPQFPSNERLEFLGDAVLDVMVSDFLFHEYPVHGYGQLKTLRESMVSNRHLHDVGSRMEVLESFALLASEKEKGHLEQFSRKTSADFVESLLGGLFLDKVTFTGEMMEFIAKQIMKKEHLNPVKNLENNISSSSSILQQQENSEEEERRRKENSLLFSKIDKIFGRKKIPFWFMSYQIPELHVLKGEDQKQRRQEFENFMIDNCKQLPSKKSEEDQKEQQKQQQQQQKEENKNLELCQKMKKLEKYLGINFRNPFLLLEAITHKSFPHHEFNLPEFDVIEQQQQQQKTEEEQEQEPILLKRKKYLNHFERLCFFGESILKFILSLHFFQTFPHHKESDYSKHISSILSKEMIYETTLKRLDLESIIRISEDVDDVFSKNKNEPPPQQISDDKFKILMQCFKAIVGALYVDQGGLYDLNEKLCPSSSGKHNHKKEVDLRFGIVHKHLIIPYTQKIQSIIIEKQKKNKNKHQNDEHVDEDEDSRIMDYKFKEDYRTKLHNLLISKGVKGKYSQSSSSSSGLSYKMRKRKHQRPKYRILSKNFEGKVKVGCYYLGQMIGVGFGRSEKGAMMNAARDTFKEFKEHFDGINNKNKKSSSSFKKHQIKESNDGNNGNSNSINNNIQKKKTGEEKEEEEITIVTDVLEKVAKQSVASFRCDICKKSFKTQGLYDQHQTDQNHLSAVQMKFALDQIEKLKKEIEEMKKKNNNND